MKLRRLPFAAPLLALSLLLTTGCEANALHEARMMDNEQAYEAFLQKYPEHQEAEWMRARMEELRFMKAKETGTSEALREYIISHPEGDHVETARTLEDELAFKEAEAKATIESYQGYLDAHPDGKFVKVARYEFGEKQYLPKVGIENLRVEKINLAADPEGPLNGWGVFADFKNNGERTLIEIEVLIHYLDDKGTSLDTDRWWAVAPGLLGMPTPPYIVPPLPPEEVRGLRWTTGDVPEGWAQTARIDITNLRFADDH